MRDLIVHFRFFRVDKKKVGKKPSLIQTETSVSAWDLFTLAKTIFQLNGIAVRINTNPILSDSEAPPKFEFYM